MTIDSLRRAAILAFPSQVWQESVDGKSLRNAIFQLLIGS